MNIFLLSQTNGLNEELTEKLQEELQKRGNKMAYVSSVPQGPERKYFHSTLQDFGVDGKYFDLSSDFSDDELKTLSSYKTIFLSGGNTFTFMESAQNRNLYSLLKEVLDNGGLVIGQSAGAIMTTPSIDIAAWGDGNDVNLVDTSGFSFVDFEFHPHFNESKAELDFVSEYSTKKNGKVYACKDGDGILISDRSINLFGNIKLFPLK